MGKAGMHLPEVFEALSAAAQPEVFGAVYAAAQPEVFEALWVAAIGRGRHALG